MPIIFVHGVASRLNTADKTHEKTWGFIEQNLRKYVAPKVANDPDNVWIREAYWGDKGVKEIKRSIPDHKQVKRLFTRKKAWIIKQLSSGQIDTELLPNTLKRLVDLTGYFFTRAIDCNRENWNAQFSLFLGDIFIYLNQRGQPELPGSITHKLMTILNEAHENQKLRGGEKLIVISHSMGGQLVYDVVSYYLPERSKLTEYNHYKDIKIDFWCAAASQVGLFQEMGLFPSNSDRSTSDKVPFPNTHLNIWWNLWDDNDYLSFTAEPFFNEVFDDLYDSGQSVFKAHTSHFEQTDFYKELALMLEVAKQAGWQRNQFLQKNSADIRGEVLNILQNVQGITEASNQDFAQATLKFHLQNGMKIKTWKKPPLGIDHVFFVDSQDQLIYGGFVSWIHSQGLESDLEEIRNRFGVTEEY